MIEEESVNEEEFKESTICGRCGRTLTARRSVKVGYGPVCFVKLFGRRQPSLRPRRARVEVAELDMSKMENLQVWFR